MNESHDPGRLFKVAITTSSFSTSSSTTTICSLIWETLVKYDYMVSTFRIFTFFNCFLKVIFWCMVFPSNSLVKESNIFGLFREYTCNTSWFVTKSAMIFLAFTNFFLCKASSLISLWNWNLYTHVGVQSIFFREIIYFQSWKLSNSQACHQADVIYHIEMRTSNGNIKGLDLTDLRCPSCPGVLWSRVCRRNPNFKNLEYLRSDWINR